MTMPSSGPLNMGGTSTPVSVAQELGLGLTTTISMNQTNVRTLAGVSTTSGTSWSMNSLYGKSNRVTANITISADTQNYVLNTAKVTGYSAGKTDVTLTINSGIYVGSSSTGGIGLDVNTSWAAGDTVTIINNGFIVGCGGGGGTGVGSGTGSAGGAGGAALRVQRAVTINNGSGTIGGGGGGGGGGGSPQVGGCSCTALGGGGGGGGGRGDSGGGAGGGGNAGVGTAGSPGSAGSRTSAGGGGGGGTYTSWTGGTGGSGGSFGASGATGSTSTGGVPGRAGGGGGNCTTSGSNANITWTATGTRFGTIA